MKKKISALNLSQRLTSLLLRVGVLGFGERLDNDYTK